MAHEKEGKVEAKKVYRTEGRSLSFKGELLAEIVNKVGTGRELRYQLWRTTGGNWVGQIAHITSWQGEKDFFEAEVLKTIEEVFQFFGGGPLAKVLYYRADLEFVEEVD